jgi:hypothetical protein
LKLYYLVSAAQSTESFSAEGEAAAFTPSCKSSIHYVCHHTHTGCISFPSEYFVKGALLGAVKG